MNPEEEIAHLKRQQHRIMGPNGSGMSAAELRDRILDLIRDYLTQPKVQADETSVLTLNALAGDIQVIKLDSTQIAGVPYVRRCPKCGLVPMPPCTCDELGDGEPSPPPAKTLSQGLSESDGGSRDNHEPSSAKGQVEAGHNIRQKFVWCEGSRSYVPDGEVGIAQLVCVYTHNPCGTDTWADGFQCQCGSCQKWRSGAAQEVLPYNPIERKLLTICPECGSKERDPRRALSTDSKRLYLCNNSWHDVEEVPSPAENGKLNRPAYERLVAEDLTWLLKQPRTLERDHVEGIVSASTKYYYEGDTRELKAALTESKKMNDEQIKHMVERFLSWRLPENFNPDGGISFKPGFNEHTSHPMKNEPVGTNLFDYTQAEAMVRYLVEGL